MSLNSLPENWFHKETSKTHSLSKARWIWAGNPNYDLVNQFSLFRRKFVCSKPPPKANLFITADTSYRLYINGKFVASGPARGYQRSWPFDELEVASYLKEGENCIAIRAFNAGRGTFQYRSEGYAGLLMYLQLPDQAIVTNRCGANLKTEST